jgi:hypothetical protein
MKKLPLILVVLSFFGCATTQEGVIPTNAMVIERPVTTPAQKIVYVDKIVQVQDPNSIKLTNLYWQTSNNFKRISDSTDYKFIFDLGVVFQIGISDGFSERKTTRDERLSLYPIFKEYSDKDKIKFIDINVAYEGGFDTATKYIQANRVIMSTPTDKKTDKDKIIQGKTENK